MARVISTKTILGGKKRISGTRISVDLIASYISHGYGVEEIKRDYPHLNPAQIASALEYLDKRTRQEWRKLEPSSA